MPFEVTGPSPLSAVVNVRLTPEEKSQLAEQAGTAGLTVSALVRKRVMGRAVVASTDAAMLRELRRLGGLFKHLFAQGADTAPALADVRRALEALATRQQP